MFLAIFASALIAEFAARPGQRSVARGYDVLGRQAAIALLATFFMSSTAVDGLDALRGGASGILSESSEFSRLRRLLADRAAP